MLQDLMEVRSRARPASRPFVTLAYAQSVDGSITIARGQRYTLSGAESLRFTHRLRACHDAILVGVGTVLADDPELRVRPAGAGDDPQPVIVDSRLLTPASAKLLRQPGRRPWIGTTDGADGAYGDRRARAEAQGCRILDCPRWPNGWVDLDVLLRRLHADGITSVMVEGGARIITSFLDAQMVDYAVVTIAPVFLGGLSAVGPPVPSRSPSSIAGDAGARALGSKLRRWTSGRLGDDLVICGEVTWSPR